ncbi:hypothetical protein JKG47_00350 [Acidithiobacillus sp. MC6.1]|nr:hypothetical protein [Acidithiobacillus sp. MC6.1]
MKVKRLTIRLNDGKPDDLEILGFLTRLEKRGDARNLQSLLKRSLREGLRIVEHEVQMGREALAEESADMPEKPARKKNQCAPKKPFDQKKRGDAVAPSGTAVSPDPVQESSVVRSRPPAGSSLADGSLAGGSPAGSNVSEPVQFVTERALSAVQWKSDGFAPAAAPVQAAPVLVSVPAPVPASENPGPDVQGIEDRTQASGPGNAPEISARNRADQPVFIGADTKAAAEPGMTTPAVPIATEFTQQTDIQRNRIFPNPEEMRLNIPTAKEVVQRHVDQQRLKNFLKSTGVLDNDGN